MKQFFVTNFSRVCFFSVILVYCAPLVSSSIELGCCSIPVREIIGDFFSRTENRPKQLVSLPQSTNQLQTICEPQVSTSDDSKALSESSNDEASSRNASPVTVYTGSNNKSANSTDLSPAGAQSSAASSSINTFKKPPFPDELLEPLRKFVTFECASYLEIHPFGYTAEENKSLARGEEKVMIDIADAYAGWRISERQEEHRLSAALGLLEKFYERIKKDITCDKELFFAHCFIIFRNTKTLKKTDIERRCQQKAVFHLKRVDQFPRQTWSWETLRPFAVSFLSNDSDTNAKNAFCRLYKEDLDKNERTPTKNVELYSALHNGYWNLWELQRIHEHLVEAHHFASKLVKDQENCSLDDLRALRDTSFRLHSGRVGSEFLEEAFETVQKIRLLFSQEETLNDRREFCRILSEKIKCMEENSPEYNAALNDFHKQCDFIEKNAKKGRNELDIDLGILSRIRLFQASQAAAKDSYLHRIVTLLDEKRKMLETKNKSIEQVDLLIEAWAHYNLTPVRSKIL